LVLLACNIITRNIDNVNDKENTVTDEEIFSILCSASLNDSDSNTLNEDSSRNILNDRTLFEHNYSIPKSISVLHIAFINVCGLCSKLINPDFIDFINQYNIVCFAETKLDAFDKPLVVVILINGLIERYMYSKESLGGGLVCL